MAPKVSEEHRLARKKQIVDAAVACFSKNGFYHSTMQDICREAKLSPGAVYGYFDGKADLIKAISEKTSDENNVTIDRIKESKGALLSTIDAFTDHFFAQLETGSTSLDIEFWAEAVRNPKVKRIIRQDFDYHIKIFVDFVREGQKKGEFKRSVSAESLVRVVMAVYQGMLVQKELDPKVDIKACVKEIKVMIKSLLMAEELHR